MNFIVSHEGCARGIHLWHTCATASKVEQVGFILMFDFD